MNHNSSSHLFIIIFSIINLIYCTVFSAIHNHRLQLNVFEQSKSFLKSAIWHPTWTDRNWAGSRPCHFHHDSFHENGCPVFCLTLENEELCFRTSARQPQKSNAPVIIFASRLSRFGSTLFIPVDTAGTHLVSYWFYCNLFQSQPEPLRNVSTL